MPQYKRDDVNGVDKDYDCRNKFSTPRSRGRVGVKTTEGRDFATMKREMLERGELFEDPNFPAVDSSIFYSRKPPRPFEWKRPSEICKDPHFFVGGASRFDVQQGELGDCWLLAAVASLSMHKELFYRVVPEDQHFNQNYCGMFRFRFWQFGKWVDVVVDDRLPTYCGQLVFLHSKDLNEFWSALLEKAYAKLMGSYESLKGGSTSEAMEDFTGGITEFFDLRKNPPTNLYQIMTKAQNRSSLMGCSIEADPNVTEAVRPDGLIMGHAYSITDVRMAEIRLPNKSGKVPLIRIRNPWGNEAEWKGAWGDSSPEWNYISKEERERLGLTFDDDGEFWMSYMDFVRNFEKLEICHLGPDSMEGDELSGKKKVRWEMCIEAGAWKKRVSAGGCRNFLDTFDTNPQFRVKVVDPDEDDDEDLGTIIIGLMQTGMRKKRKEGAEMHTIGYVVYKLKDPHCGPLETNFFKYNASVARSNFINLREVCDRYKLPPGDYVIIPSTFEPNQEADFLVRIFSEQPYESGEMDNETTMSTPEGKREPTGPHPAAAPIRDVTPADDRQTQTLRDSFDKIAGDDMEIDAYELRDILNAAFRRGKQFTEFKFDGFSVETCRSMVAMKDVDQSGKLGFDEFRDLWNGLRYWKTVFKKYDVDKSGNFNSYELRKALNAVGFRVSNKIFNSLVMRYSDKKGIIEFDDFILCCVRLKTVFETYGAQEKDGRGRAIFDQNEFIQCIMYV